MNNKLTYAIAFILGAGVGSVVAWQFLKTKYEKILDEELESMEEYYSKKEELPEFTVQEDYEVNGDDPDYVGDLLVDGLKTGMTTGYTKAKPTVNELVSRIKELQYNTKDDEDLQENEEQLSFTAVDFNPETGAVERVLRKDSKNATEFIFQEKEDDIMQSEPYVITPEEFGENEDYNTVSLTYYADHILTYEDDELVEDIDGLVGEESLTHFGEYEDDSVFVRNDVCKTDYEILLDEREFMDVHDSNLYPGDDE